MALQEAGGHLHASFSAYRGESLKGFPCHLGHLGPLLSCFAAGSVKVRRAWACVAEDHQDARADQPLVFSSSSWRPSCSIMRTPKIMSTFSISLPLRNPSSNGTGTRLAGALLVSGQAN
jgi:hypothetical protein